MVVPQTPQPGSIEALLHEVFDRRYKLDRNGTMFRMDMFNDLSSNEASVWERLGEDHVRAKALSGQNPSGKCTPLFAQLDQAVASWKNCGLNLVKNLPEGPSGRTGRGWKGMRFKLPNE